MTKYHGTANGHEAFLILDNGSGTLESKDGVAVILGKTLTLNGKVAEFDFKQTEDGVTATARKAWGLNIDFVGKEVKEE